MIKNNVVQLHQNNEPPFVCERCARPINSGEDMLTITTAREKVISPYETQPYSADMSFVFCIECADKVDLASLTVQWTPL